ncbi:MAG TPA: alpha-amylase family glycosyl hydrolase [Blastocatellia bacterium]|nr:alpha-amylase family glycosyl hydrolase [Blastocatellia bacterium]
MRRTSLILTALIVLTLSLRLVEAQFTTPTVNGSIAANEYGVHSDGQNQQSTGTGQTWYMTWDDTNLYVGITNANLGEGAVIYIDKDPVSPVNGGTNANGNLTGFSYDNTNFAALPFRADFVTYYKDGYREYRTANGAGGWSAQTAFFGSYASGPGNVRELAIPWSAITGGGRPASFLFFGYLTSPGGFVYGQVPQDNAGAFIGTSASYSHYYTVSSTANGASTKPFSINSSSAPGTINFSGLRHDTFDDYYRSPFGAVPAGTSVTVRFRTDHFDVDGVSVRVYTYDPATDMTTGPVDYPMTFLENRTENSTLYDIWTRTLATPAAPAVLYYKFRITDGSTVAFYSDAYADDHDNLNQGGEGAASDSEPFPAFQITVYNSSFTTPEWLHQANVYQIFPDRFRNGDATNDYCRAGTTTGCPTFYGTQTPIAHTTWNEAIYDPRVPGPYFNEYGTQFFGGDLKGIQDKLDYLQALGIDTLYLTPIFKARSNHRYDTDNYLEVDPALGGDAALAALTQEAERRGVRLIFDGVFNHSSSDSLYFDRYHRYNPPPDGGCESAASPYRSWYNFFGSGPCDGSNYEAWFGFDSLPAFKDDSPDVRNFFYRDTTDSVVKHWYARGASGWRFDVADNITHNWWHDFRPFAKSYKTDGPLVGEIWPDASQYLAGDQLDSVMNYRFRKNVVGFARGAANWSDNDNNGNNTIVALTPSQFDHALKSVREDYPPQATAAMLNLIDSHDTNRALYTLTEAGDSGLAQAKERLRLAALFQFTYIGAPMIYYGDEGALNAPSLANGANGPEDDPYNRAPYPWADETGDANVYGPIDNAQVAFYTTLAHLRKQHVALRDGAFATLLTGDTTPSSTDNHTFAFARAGGGETAIVALNNGSTSDAASIPVAAYFADGTQLQDALAGTTYTVSGGAVSLTLAARSGAVLLPYPALVDMTPPVAATSVSPAANAAGWNNSAPVTVSLSASDSGSGVKELRYWINDGGVTVVAGSSAMVTVSAEGVSTVNVRAIDNAGNVSTLASRIVKIDLTQPTVTCPAPMTVAADAGCQAAIPNVAQSVKATDNLTPAASLLITQSPAAGTMVSTGSHSVTVTVTDLAGNSKSCMTTVGVIDNTPPTITCPANQTAVASPAACSVGGSQVVNYPPPTASDNCPGVTVACVPPSGSTFTLGTTTVTCTATDTSGNTASCSFTVTTFDACLQDDANPATVLLFNSQTGDYRFCCGGTVFTGKGKVTVQGCTISLQHVTTDRRVQATIDKASFRGTASLQTPPGVTRCTITDRDTRNNNCKCP